MEPGSWSLKWGPASSTLLVAIVPSGGPRRAAKEKDTVGCVIPEWGVKGVCTSVFMLPAGRPWHGKPV